MSPVGIELIDWYPLFTEDTDTEEISRGFTHLSSCRHCFLNLRIIKTSSQIHFWAQTGWVMLEEPQKDVCINRYIIIVLTRNHLPGVILQWLKYYAYVSGCQISFLIILTVSLFWHIPLSIRHWQYVSSSLLLMFSFACSYSISVLMFTVCFFKLRLDRFLWVAGA